MSEKYQVERIEYVVGDGYRYQVKETDEGICDIQYQEIHCSGNHVEYIDEGQSFTVPFDVIPLLAKAAQSVYGANHE